MMRLIALAKRNYKEIVRDPITLVFAIILPLFLLFIFQQFDIPSEVYNLSNFAPSIIIFGFSFLTLFSATLIAKDRSSSLLTRLYASPLRSYEFIIGYSIALLPIALIQMILFFALALILGLTFSFNVILTILVMLPISLLFIGLGLLIGSLVNDKAAPGLGSVIVQLVAFTSGMYFDINVMGNVIKLISKILPFSYSVDISRALLNNNMNNLLPSFLIVAGYIIIIYIITSVVFKNKMTNDNK